MTISPENLFNELCVPTKNDMMIKPSITISPFNYPDIDIFYTKNFHEIDQKSTRTWLRSYLERDYQLTLSGRHGINLALLDLKLSPDDVVTIFPSCGNYYVSGCVTKTIEKHCKWSMNIESTTKVIFVIHEWGIPHPEIEKICDLGYPLIEDCAYAFASRYSNKRVGLVGNYAIYSLPKFFPVNFGGVICGLSGQEKLINATEEKYLLNSIGSIDDIKNICTERIVNWNYLKDLFQSIGIEPHFELFAGLVPGVFMFKVHADIQPELVKIAFQQHGIESSVFYGSHSIFIPCHQKLGLGSMNYIFKIYKELAHNLETDFRK